MKIGIIREQKVPTDKRVVFTPDTCVKTVKKYPDIEFFIEKSNMRCFLDKEYSEKGFHIVDDVSNCDILIGIKEVPIEKLIPNKKYFFFSHTIKEQEYNRDMIKEIVKRNNLILVGDEDTFPVFSSDI